MKKEMTLDEFREVTLATDNNDGTWTVLVPAFNGPVFELTIDNCSDEYDAYERAFLYCLSEVEKANEKRKS
jgi:hypothetical protein